MDSPQYLKESGLNKCHIELSFKPYYKWIVLNTDSRAALDAFIKSFKPYYKWIVLNTSKL